MHSALVGSYVVSFVAAAPLIGGAITRIKNGLRMRRGQSVFQQYFNIVKFFSKGEVVSATSSWIFRAAPCVAVSSSVAAAVMVVSSAAGGGAAGLGDLVALVFIFSLGRFFLALAALDTGSAFGGMGSSREMFISSLVEPALMLVVFCVSLRCQTTALSALGGSHAPAVSALVAALALLLLAIAETSRVPVDNQETHLELTMVHEAMVLEYSGRSLALLELAASVKQMVLLFLVAEISWPVASYGSAAGMAAIAARMAALCVVVACIEVSVAKMRLFRVTDFLAFSFVLGVVAVICALLGV